MKRQQQDEDDKIAAVLYLAILLGFISATILFAILFTLFIF